MSLGEGETADPEVSAVVAEYALMMDTSLTLSEIEAMPAEQAALFLAVAERTMRKRGEEAEKIKAKADAARR